MSKLIKSDYKGLQVQFNTDAWFNATVVANHFGKRPIDWLKLDSTKEYISTLKDMLVISEESSLIKTVRNKGTWLHPKLGVVFARWLDTRFAIWCDDQIHKIITGQHNSINWEHARHEAKSSFKVMNQILLEGRKEQGKDSKPHHFMNEAKLVNWAICGQFKGLNRDELSKQNLDLLAKLEINNAVMLAQGKNREQRKESLSLISKTFTQLSAKMPF